MTATTMMALAVATAAAACDWRWRRVPDCLTLAILPAALVLATMNQGLPGFMGSFAALVVTTGTGYWLYARGAVAGGDVKLLAALGALLGIAGMLDMLAVALVGGMLAAGVCCACVHRAHGGVRMATLPFAPVVLAALGCVTLWPGARLSRLCGWA